MHPRLMQRVAAAAISSQHCLDSICRSALSLPRLYSPPCSSASAPSLPPCKQRLCKRRRRAAALSGCLRWVGLCLMPPRGDCSVRLLPNHQHHWCGSCGLTSYGLPSIEGASGLHMRCRLLPLVLAHNALRALAAAVEILRGASPSANPCAILCFSSNLPRQRAAQALSSRVPQPGVA